MKELVKTPLLVVELILGFARPLKKDDEVWELYAKNNPGKILSVSQHEPLINYISKWWLISVRLHPHLKRMILNSRHTISIVELLPRKKGVFIWLRMSEQVHSGPHVVCQASHQTRTSRNDFPSLSHKGLAVEADEAEAFAFTTEALAFAATHFAFATGIFSSSVALSGFLSLWHLSHKSVYPWWHLEVFTIGENTGFHIGPHSWKSNYL